MLFEDVRREKMLMVLEKAQKSGLFKQSELNLIGEMLGEGYVFSTAVFRLQQYYDNMESCTPEEVLGRLESVLLPTYQLGFEVKDEDVL